MGLLLSLDQLNLFGVSGTGDVTIDVCVLSSAATATIYAGGSVTIDAPRIKMLEVRVGGGTLPIHISPVAPHWPIAPLPIYQPEQPSLPIPVEFVAKVDNRPAIVALYAAGALDDEEFTALLAAA